MSGTTAEATTEPDPQFREIVGAAASDWRPIRRPGVDPNTIDLWWLARRIEQRITTPVPTELPAKELGVTLIDQCVEGKLVSGLIRDLDRDELTSRSWDVVVCAGGHGFRLDTPLLSLVALLHAWTGCIGMAKDLRRATSTGEVYTEAIRKDGYEVLREMWEEEDARGNPWLRYGVTLARALEMRRGNVPVDGWVPRESPYWM